MKAKFMRFILSKRQVRKQREAILFIKKAGVEELEKTSYFLLLFFLKSYFFIIYCCYSLCLFFLLFFIVVMVFALKH